MSHDHDHDHAGGACCSSCASGGACESSCAAGTCPTSAAPPHQGQVSGGPAWDFATTPSYLEAFAGLQYATYPALQQQAGMRYPVAGFAGAAEYGIVERGNGIKDVYIRHHSKEWSFLGSKKGFAGAAVGAVPMPTYPMREGSSSTSCLTSRCKQPNGKAIMQHWSPMYEVVAAGQTLERAPIETLDMYDLDAAPTTGVYISREGPAFMICEDVDLAIALNIPPELDGCPVLVQEISEIDGERVAHVAEPHGLWQGIVPLCVGSMDLT